MGPADYSQAPSKSGEVAQTQSEPGPHAELWIWEGLGKGVLSFPDATEKHTRGRLQGFVRDLTCTVATTHKEMLTMMTSHGVTMRYVRFFLSF